MLNKSTIKDNKERIIHEMFDNYQHNPDIKFQNVQLHFFSLIFNLQ